MKTIITHSASETQKVAEAVLSSLQHRNILALHGDLGGGKTTFSQGIGKALGINQKMISPTFILVRQYELEKIKSKSHFAKLYHIDLYRIQRSEEIIDLGILDFAKDSTNLLLIEWAEKMGEYLSDRRVDVRFEYIAENDRKIEIT